MPEYQKIDPYDLKRKVRHIHEREFFDEDTEQTVMLSFRKSTAAQYQLALDASQIAAERYLTGKEGEEPEAFALGDGEGGKAVISQTLLTNAALMESMQAHLEPALRYSLDDFIAMSQRIGLTAWIEIVQFSKVVMSGAADIAKNAQSGAAN